MQRHSYLFFIECDLTGCSSLKNQKLDDFGSKLNRYLYLENAMMKFASGCNFELFYETFAWI